MIYNKLYSILGSTHLILPEMVLVLGLILLVIISILDVKKTFIPFFTAISTVLIYLFFVTYFFEKELETKSILTGFSGMIYIDSASVFFRQLISFSAFIMLIHARLLNYKFNSEVYIIFFSVLVGLAFLTMTTNFLLVFVSLEIISISSYMLVAINKTKLNFEAAIKYLIFGAASTAFMLYGISFFYGLIHELNFSSPIFQDIAKNNSQEVIQVISFLFLSGVFFKTALAPFQNWVPDVYEATPTPIVSFLSFAPKAAGFLILARFINFLPTDLNLVLVIVIVLSLIIGNLAALNQTNVKRMLGYSGIAQSGFILIGFLGHQSNDFYSSFFYLLIYLPITMGSFFLVDILNKYSGSFEIKSFSGIGQKNIFLGINALIIMVALVGLPPTSGFIAKLSVFSTLIDAEKTSLRSLYYGILIFGLLNAAVSIYYYLKIPFYMLVKRGSEIVNTPSLFFLTFILLYFSGAILYSFFFPDSLSNAVFSISF